MPRGDGTGPNGMGPMTGRGAGYCAGYSVPGFASPVGGRYIGTGWGAFSGGDGRGAGSGRGKGYRNWYNATGLPGWSRYNAGMPAWGAPPPSPGYPNVNPYEGPASTPDQEKEMLKEQADFLKQQLEDIQARLAEVEKETHKKEK